MIEIGAHLLGRTREHDPKSWDFQHGVVRLSTKHNVLHRIGGKCLNQAKLGSCEGNTAAEFLNSDTAARNRAAYNAHAARVTSALLGEPDAVRLYSLATNLDNDEIPGRYPPTDTGTSGVGIAKSMQELSGLQRYNWTFTFEAFLATLQTQPVMLGTDWYQSMFETDSSGYVVPPKRGASPAGGHAFLAFARDWANNRTGCTNHWTGDWGTTIGDRAGCFWIHDSLLERLLITEKGDSLVPVLQ